MARCSLEPHTDGLVFVPGDLLGATQAAPSHHDQQGLGHLRGRRLQVIHGGAFRFPKVGLAAAAVITLPASMAAIAHHMWLWTVWIRT